MDRPTLQALIGQDVLVLSPILHPNELQTITILGVEYGGIWLKSEAFSQRILKETELAAARTLMLFVPFSLITCIVVAGDTITLSEKAFGV